ncbi:hypothetical protein [Rhizobium laguerreae]|uniref:Uncharacterized protein n=1 Tax=Rhizobium laguerreae TaxID=1076926 RepID=A0A7Y2RB84_9HYPH|nr:hypothetical protein [Rhizobium laguerreae]NNH67786.1 hypothetical protein [Rhizobium laguerreae]
MSEIKHTPTPWGLCYHLRSPEHDAACTCGYRGSIWSADGEYIVLEMGSSPDVDGTGTAQGYTQPQADRPTQLADAAFIVEAVNSHASLTEERDRLREENARLLAFVRSFKFTCVEDIFYKDCYLNIVEPDSASFRLGNGSQFSLFIGKLEERRAALSPPTAEGV